MTAPARHRAPRAGAVLVLFSVILGALSALARVGVVIAVTELARRLPGGDDTVTLAGIAAAAAVAAALLQTSSMTASYAGAGRIVHELRSRLLAHLNRLPLSWFSTRSTGLVRHAVLEDPSWPHVVNAEIYVGVSRSSALAVAALGYLFWVSPILAVVVCVPPLLVLLLRRGGRSDHVREAQREAGADSAAVHVATTEVTQGAAVFRVYGASGDTSATGRFERAVRAESATTRRAGLLQWRAARGAALAGEEIAGIAVVLAAGVPLVLAGLAAPLDLIPFLLLGDALGAALSMLAMSWGMRTRNRDVLKAHDEVMRAPTLEVLPARTPTRRSGDAVLLHDVLFGYEPDRLVLDGLSLRVAAGTRVALVGPSGAGKSTLAQLLPRLHDPLSGEIAILGDDIRTLEPEVLFARIAFVFQDTPLLHRSVRDNLLIARADATDAEIAAAARATQLHERILTLPRGYDSVIGEDAELSGGQAQRLALTRALLADPPVLVLDEPTSHADAATDAALLRAISAPRADGTARTVLMITHRLVSATDFDRIIVMDGGRIVEDGTHEHLLEAEGRYAALWQARAAHREDEGEDDGC